MVYCRKHKWQGVGVDDVWCPDCLKEAAENWFIGKGKSASEIFLLDIKEHKIPECERGHIDIIPHRR
jgi:hypothetical protein